MVVTNATGSALTNVRITDTLPAGFVFGGIEVVQPLGCSAGENAGQVLGVCATLGSGQVMQVVFTGTVTVAGQDVVNSFVWTADELPGERPGGTCVNVPCGGSAPRARVDVLATAKQAGVSAARMGELVSYTIVVSNPSESNVSVTVTDTLAVSATLESATPGYVQSGQTLVWENVVVPANETAVLTVTVRAASGPLPGGYVLNNGVVILADGVEISRNAAGVPITPWRAYAPIVRRP
ncbi:MAG: DUF11 domain-containing protein [Thermoflexales bacterium]|nr:DUF11 domain-containing protein [Thermoflexales bacterium]